MAPKIVLENLEEKTKVEASKAGDSYAKGGIEGDQWSEEGSRVLAAENIA